MTVVCILKLATCEVQHLFTN